MRRRATAPAAVALLVLAAAAIATRYGLRLHNPQQDEYQVVFGGRYFAERPFDALFDTTVFNRGPERLSSILLAFPDAIFSSTPRQMQAGHAVLALAYALTAVPGYLLARGLGATRIWALGVAALVVLGPWLIFGTTYLDVAAACSTLALLLWASWRVAVAPAWHADVLVLACALLAVLARVGALPFLVVTAIVALVAGWRATDGPGFAGRARRFPLAMLRRHPVLVPLGVAAMAAIVVVGPRAVAGPAYRGAINGLPTASQLWHYLPAHFAELAMGTGYLPMIIGLPWVAVQLVRPSSPRTGAFAVLAVASVLVFAGLAAQAGATLEERYVAVLGVLPVVAFGAALWRREASVPGTAVAAVLVGWAVTTQGIYPSDDGFSYFIAPARQFFSNVVLGHLDVLLHVGQSRTAAVVALAVVGAVAVAVVAVARGTVRWVAPAVIVALCLLGLAEGVYAMRMFSTLAGAPNLTWQQLSFIDERVGGDRVIGYNSEPGERDRVFEFELARFFNRRIGDGFDPQQHLDRATGAIRLPPAPYLLRLDGFGPLVLNADPVGPANPIFGPTGLQLARFRGAPRVVATVDGASGGVLAPGQTVRVAALGSLPAGSCATIAATGATAGPPQIRYRLTATGATRSGTLAAGAAATLRMPFGRGRQVALRATGRGRTVDGKPVSLYLGTVDVARC